MAMRKVVASFRASNEVEKEDRRKTERRSTEADIRRNVGIKNAVADKPTASWRSRSDNRQPIGATRTSSTPYLIPYIIAALNRTQPTGPQVYYYSSNNPSFHLAHQGILNFLLLDGCSLAPAVFSYPAICSPGSLPFAIAAGLIPTRHKG